MTTITRIITSGTVQIGPTVRACGLAERTATTAAVRVIDATRTRESE
jgi:hypothetical protein